MTNLSTAKKNLFRHGGISAEYWKGYYGTKMKSGSVRFRVQQNETHEPLPIVRNHSFTDISRSEPYEHQPTPMAVNQVVGLQTKDPNYPYSISLNPFSLQLDEYSADVDLEYLNYKNIKSLDLDAFLNKPHRLVYIQKNTANNTGPLLVSNDHDFSSSDNRLVMFGGNAETPILIPSPDWITVAHDNGVKIYGNILFHASHGGTAVCNIMHIFRKYAYGDDQEQGIKYPFMKKLAQLAHKHGIDGWHVNFEFQQGDHYSFGYSDCKDLYGDSMISTGVSLIALDRQQWVDYYNRYALEIANDTNTPATDILVYGDGRFVDYSGVPHNRYLFDGMVLPEYRYIAVDSHSQEDKANIDPEAFYSTEGSDYFFGVEGSQGMESFKSEVENNFFYLPKRTGLQNIDFVQGGGTFLSPIPSMRILQSYNEYVSPIMSEGVVPENIDKSSSSIVTIGDVIVPTTDESMQYVFSDVLTISNTNQFQSEELIASVPANFVHDGRRSYDNISVIVGFINPFIEQEISSEIQSIDLDIGLSIETQDGSDSDSFTTSISLGRSDSNILLYHSYNTYLERGAVIQKVHIKNGNSFLPINSIGINSIDLVINDDLYIFPYNHPLIFPQNSIANKFSSSAVICQQRHTVADFSGTQDTEQNTEATFVSARIRGQRQNRREEHKFIFKKNNGESYFLGATSSRYFSSSYLPASFGDGDLVIESEVGPSFLRSNIERLDIINDVSTVSKTNSTFVSNRNGATIDTMLFTLNVADDTITDITWKVIGKGTTNSHYLDNLNGWVKYGNEFHLPRNAESSMIIASFRVLYKRGGCVFSQEIKL